MLGELDALEMRAELRMAFPYWRQWWPRVKVETMRGKPYELDDLTRVSVYAAKHIVVVRRHAHPRVGSNPAECSEDVCGARARVCDSPRVAPGRRVAAAERGAPAARRRLAHDHDGVRAAMPARATQP